MSSSSSPVLVLGATGQIASEVIRGLIAKNVSVVGTARDVAKAHAALPTSDKLTILKADFNNPATIQEAATQSKAQQVFFYAEAGQPGVLDALKNSGIKHVVFVSTSFIGLPGPRFAIQDYAIGHEEAIKAAGFTWTMLRAEGFMSNSFRWKYDIAHGTFKWPYADVPVPIVAIEDIASVAVDVFTSHDYDNKIVTIAGPEGITPKQQMAAISKAIGKPIAMVEQSEDEFRETAKAFVPAPFIDSILAYARFRKESGPDYQAQTDKLVKGKVTFQEFAEKHKAAYAV